MESSDITVNLIIILIILFIFSSIGLPILLGGIGLGNPKAVYIYDIDSSCNSQSIYQGLNHISGNSGLTLIEVPYARYLGGIGYSCRYTSSRGYAGEAESGYFAGGYIIISWNIVTLYSNTEPIVIHETLHDIGFKHTTYSNSIMYPTNYGSSNIDLDIVEFINTWYVKNPLAYLNILTFNMIYAILILLGIIVYIDSKINK